MSGPDASDEWSTRPLCPAASPLSPVRGEVARSSGGLPPSRLPPARCLSAAAWTALVAAAACVLHQL